MYNQEYINFGKRLAELRNKMNLSQKDFAAKFNMPQQTYQGYESGITKVTLSLLKVFAAFFNVSIDYLACGTNEHKLYNTQEIHEIWSNKHKEILSLYNQLDEGDKGEIRGTIRQMLKDEKYSAKKEPSEM
ncbi:MAG: helix-turn-helix domain-containing protein [Syntrophomonadaceae bacterium]|jgi:transcriptional regulator with XRE-family HTH domain|nr:helix-turn-helix domain-containing protein [Syntrophomonadaceae bacterium]